MEKVDVYNKNRIKLNYEKKREKLEKGEFSISAHVWILNNNKLLIQKRAKNKKHFPNLWEQSGGGVIAGETSFEAAIREVAEELNLKCSSDEIFYIGSYTRIHDFVDIWLIKTNINLKDLQLQKGEVSEIKEVNFENFEKMIQNGEVVPTINPSYKMLKNYCKYYAIGK